MSTERQETSSRGAWRRLLALGLVFAVLLVSLVTTAISLGRYCLTTDGSDVRELPWRGD